MELDEMKTLWGEMSVKLDRQIDLSEKVIREMTQARLDKKVNAFWNSHILAFVFATVVIGTLLINLRKLDNWLELTSAFVWIVYLAIMPFVSLGSFRPLKNIDVGKLSYKENLSLFFKSKRRVWITQKISLILNPFLFIGAIVLNAKLFLKVDISLMIGSSLTLSILVISFLASTAAMWYIYRNGNAYLSSLQEFIRESEG